MDPFSSIAARVLYERRVVEGLQRQRWAEVASSVAGGLRPPRRGLLAVLASLLVG